MKYMDEAIKEASHGISHNEGGPFGTVIVKDGKIVGRGHNEVIKNNDPTCHGEIMAIHDACKNLNTFDLSGCVLYTTGYPCPMCYGAIRWANIDKVYYGCSTLDAENIGFRDEIFYQDKKFKENNLIEQDREKCLKLFEDYKNLSNKTKY